MLSMLLDRILAENLNFLATRRLPTRPLVHRCGRPAAFSQSKWPLTVSDRGREPTSWSRPCKHGAYSRSTSSSLKECKAQAVSNLDEQTKRKTSPTLVGIKRMQESIKDSQANIMQSTKRCQSKMGTQNVRCKMVSTTDK